MYIYGSIPFFECLARAEYTRNRKDRHGEFYPAVAHAVRCVRGHSLWFQVIFTERHAGAAFMLPIEALVSKPCPPAPTAAVQPWDVFSSDFGVSADTFTARGALEVLPARTLAQYRFTIDFAGSDLAEHPEQHKALHVVFREDGVIGAYPNNRLLWSDPAFWTTTTERPDFESLAGEFRAEGNQELFARAAAPEVAIGETVEATTSARPGQRGIVVRNQGGRLPWVVRWPDGLELGYAAHEIRPLVELEER